VYLGADRGEQMSKIDLAKLSELLSTQVEKEHFAPVHVQRNGKDVAVVLMPERYNELLMKGEPPTVNPLIVELLHESIKKHSKLYEALSKLG